MGEKIPRRRPRGQRGSAPRFLPVLLLLVAAAPGRADDAPPADPPPTPEETLLLELLNRARADPAAEAERIAAARADLSWGSKIDWEKFRAELAAVPPAPPLVFDPLVLRAARHHRDYLDANDPSEASVSGHVEEPGRPGFTGTDLVERFRAVGLPPYGAENVSYEADLWAAHASLVVDYSNRTPDGMQPERGHRRNDFSPGLSGFGVAVGSAETQTPVTWDFAYPSGRRLGGVAYLDANGNRFYDPGEGIGGALVTAGDRETRTCPSGAFWLDVPETAFAVRIRVGDLDFSSEVPAGKENAKRDAVLLSDADTAALDDRLAALAGRSPDPSGSRRDRADLLALDEFAREAPLDDGRRARVEALTREAVRRLEGDRRTIRDAVANGPDEDDARRLRELAGTYRETVAERWFRDAETVFRLARRHAGPLARPEQLDASRRERIASALDEAAAALATPEWVAWLHRAARRIRDATE